MAFASTQPLRPRLWFRPAVAAALHALLALVVLVVFVAVLPVAPVFAQDPDPTGNPDPDPPRPGAGDENEGGDGEDETPAERAAFLRQLMKSPNNLVRREATAAAEKLADELPLAVAEETFADWHTDGTQDVRRAALQFLDGLRMCDRHEELLLQGNQAGVPEVDSERFFRVTVADTADGLDHRYAWLRSQETEPGSTVRVFHFTTITGRDLVVKRDRRARPQDLPRIVPGDFGVIARTVVQQIFGGDSPAPDATRHASEIVLLAVFARQTGRRVLAGELLAAADRLLTHIEGHPDNEDENAAQQRLHEFVREHLAAHVLTVTLESHAAGAPLEQTEQRIRAMREALDPHALRPRITDVLAGLDLTRKATPPEGDRPAESPTDDADRAALARWLVHELADVAITIPAAGTDETLGLFANDAAPLARRLWQLNVHGAPALLAAIRDRRLTRTLLPGIGGAPWPVRVGDLCYLILRRISGRMLNPVERPLSPVPCLDHDEAIAQQMAAKWWDEVKNLGEARFLEMRLSDEADPDRLQLVDRYLQIDIDQAMARIRQMLAAGKVDEIEAELVHRMITQNYVASAVWLRNFVSKATQPESRLLIARALFENQEDPTGADAIWADVQSGRFAADKNELAMRLDLLRAIALKFPDSYRDMNARIAGLLAPVGAGAGLDDWQRLALLGYLAELRADVPAEFVTALLDLLQDCRVVGSARKPQQVPDEVSGMFAPRWRDYAAAGIDEMLGDKVDHFRRRWNAALPDRDAAAAELLQAVAQAFPGLLEDDDLKQRVAAAERPAITPLTRAQATPLLIAVLNADDGSPELATARANALNAGAALWKELVPFTSMLRNDQRARMLELATDLCNVIRRVRVHPYTTTAESNMAADELRIAVTAALNALEGEVVSAATLRSALSNVVSRSTADAPIVGVSFLLTRGPSGVGAELEITITIDTGARNDDEEKKAVGRLRAAAARDGQPIARASSTAGMQPDEALLEWLLGDFGQKLDAALATRTVLVEARLTLAPATDD